MNKQWMWVVTPVAIGVLLLSLLFLANSSVQGQGTWTTVWSCPKCADELGRGNEPPDIKTCPTCGADLIDQPPVELKKSDVKEGTGRAAREGDLVQVHYTGKLANGKKFDSSLDRQKPLSFQIGKGEVIKGWDKGVVGMKVGGVRKLVIPPDLAYGPEGRPPTIPPSSELHFEITLLKIQ